MTVDIEVIKVFVECAFSKMEDEVLAECKKATNTKSASSAGKSIRAAKRAIARMEFIREGMVGNYIYDNYRSKGQEAPDAVAVVWQQLWVRCKRARKNIEKASVMWDIKPTRKAG